MQFDQFEVKDFVFEYLKSKHFTALTPIQKEVLTNLKKNNNMLCQSKTGSGKTLAFLIPIFNKLDLNKQEVSAVICAPTRELALQIYNVAIEVAAFAPKKIDIRV